MRTIFILVSLGLFISCSQLEKESSPYGLQRRKVEEYFVSSGVIRYFLPEIPFWANFSETAACRRHVSIKYLDLKMVRGSLSLSYEEAIQLQLMLNVQIAELKKEQHIDHIPFKEEEALFFKASDRIQAGIRTFRVPDYKKVHLIWIDHHLNKPQEIKNLMAEARMNQGHPVFVSLCMTRKELEDWMAKNSFSGKNIRLLSYELLSPYSIKGNLDTKYHVYLEELMGDKKMIFFVPKKQDVPKVFEGNFSKQIF